MIKIEQVFIDILKSFARINFNHYNNNDYIRKKYIKITHSIICPEDYIVSINLTNSYKYKKLLVISRTQDDRIIIEYCYPQYTVMNIDITDIDSFLDIDIETFILTYGRINEIIDCLSYSLIEDLLSINEDLREMGNESK